MKKKQTVRLTESQLHRVIKESVKNVLNEMSGTTLASYAAARGDQAKGERPLSPAQKRVQAKRPKWDYYNSLDGKREVGEREAANAWTRDFGKKVFNKPTVLHGKIDNYQTMGNSDRFGYNIYQEYNTDNSTDKSRSRTTSYFYNPETDEMEHNGSYDSNNGWMEKEPTVNAPSREAMEAAKRMNQIKFGKRK